MSFTLIEAPYPQEVNYLAGKEAPSSVQITYLRCLNYSEYGRTLKNFAPFYISKERKS